MSSSEEEEVVTSGRRPTSGRNRTRPSLADDEDSSEEGNLFDTSDEENDTGNDQQADHNSSFSVESLQQALIRLKSSLDPPLLFDETSMTSWNDVKNIISQNAIKLDRVDELAEDIATSSQLSVEFRCLVSAIATNACQIYQKANETKHCQALFTSKDKKDKAKFVANFVGNAWLQESTSALKSARGDKASNMHVQLLLSGMEFIQASFVIDNGKKLALLKDKRDMDWQDMVDKIFQMSKEHGLIELHAAAESAKKHLENLISPPSVEDAVKSSTTPVPVARKASLQDIQASKREERLAQMKSKARGMSVRQVVAAPAPVPNITSIPRAFTQSEPTRPGFSSTGFTAGEKEPPRSAWSEAKSDFPSAVTLAAESITQPYERYQDTATPTQRPYPQARPDSRPPARQLAAQQPNHHAPHAPAHMDNNERPLPQGRSGGGFSGDHDSRAARAPPADYNRDSSSSIDVGGARGSVAWENSASSQRNVVPTSHDNQTDGAGAAYGGYGPSGYGTGALTAPVVLDHKTDYPPYQGKQKRPGHPTDFQNNKRPRNASPYDEGLPQTANISRNSSSNNALPPMPPPLADGGAGRGRGRGSHVNLPAWMTAGGNTDGPPAANISSNSNNALPPMPPPLADGGGGRGGGRGSHVTLPAWMTAGGNTDGPQTANLNRSSSNNALPPMPPPLADGGGGRGSHVNLPAWMTAGGNTDGPQSANLIRSSGNNALPPMPPPLADGGGGRGGGRGSHVNLPAWMTAGGNTDGPQSANLNRSSSNNALPPMPPPLADGGGGRGGGRGSHVNLPAWMTAGNTDGPPSANLTSASAPPPMNPNPLGRIPPPHSVPGGTDHGRGRGRGVHTNLPAWMTAEGGGGNGPPLATGSHYGAPAAPLRRADPGPGGFSSNGPPGRGGFSSNGPPGRGGISFYGPPGRGGFPDNGPPGRGGFPDNGPPGGGRGRGRGGSVNLPAWMAPPKSSADDV